MCFSRWIRSLTQFTLIQLFDSLVAPRQSGMCISASWPTSFLFISCYVSSQNFSDSSFTSQSVSQNGSLPCRLEKRQRLSRMSPNLCFQGALACATFLNTKVSQHLPSPSHLHEANCSLCRSDQKVVYRRYASLFFIAGCSATDNELISLEIVHRYVEQMDKYYGNVCELDIIFNFQKAYFILDELLLAGEMQESSKKNVLRCISQQDSLEDIEVSG
jgi:Clathrin adaptor complex small chain